MEQSPSLLKRNGPTSKYIHVQTVSYCSCSSSSCSTRFFHDYLLSMSWDKGSHKHNYCCRTWRTFLWPWYLRILCNPAPPATNYFMKCGSCIFCCMWKYHNLMIVMHIYSLSQAYIADFCIFISLSWFMLNRFYNENYTINIGSFCRKKIILYRDLTCGFMLQWHRWKLSSFFTQIEV